MPKIAKFKNLQPIESRDNGEDLVMVDSYNSNIKYQYLVENRKECFAVRRSVAEKLAQANRVLQNIDKAYCLLVVYGYRSPATQRSYFQQEWQRLSRIYPDYNFQDLREKVHENIAVPEVAGHPTGGAVDLTIYDQVRKREWDMGSRIMDFVNGKNYTFAADISARQRKNRLFLRDLMLEQGFAPFYPEWWHFCYGDKEWAWFYGQKEAIYEQIEEENSFRN